MLASAATHNYQHVQNVPACCTQASKVENLIRILLPPRSLYEKGENRMNSLIHLSHFLELSRCGRKIFPQFFRTQKNIFSQPHGNIKFVLSKHDGNLIKLRNCTSNTRNGILVCTEIHTYAVTYLGLVRSFLIEDFDGVLFATKSSKCCSKLHKLCRVTA